jgi:subtilisin-like proprotein convertase family protein
MFLTKYLKSAGLALVLAVSMVRGALISESATVNTAIPDGNASGLASTITVSSEFNTIQSLELSLHISALSSESLAYGGDLYCSLQNESGGFDVLLNRVGVTDLDPWGYDMNGVDVTFTLSGDDIHKVEEYSPSYDSSGRLTGSWDADGRNIDPSAVTDTDARTAGLNSFIGTNPNGTWTLFIADTQLNGTAKLDSWGLSIEAVPEPATITLIGLIGGIMLFIRRFLG